MKRTIKLRTGAAKTVEDTTHKIMTIQEWREEGTRRFGEDYMDWKFECPMCGHIASIRDFKEAGAKGPDCACQECLGRYTGKGPRRREMRLAATGRLMDSLASRMGRG